MGNTLSKDLEDARMNFTRWVSTEMLLPADEFQSLVGMPVHALAAVRLASNQGAWDLLIPDHLGTSFEPLVPQKMITVLFKVRS